MDIFEWTFSSKKKEAHLPQVESLKESLRDETKLFDKLWKAYRKKRHFIEVAEKERISILKKVPKLNNKILDSFAEVIKIDDILDVLVKKILYEATERLHQVEGSIWRFGKKQGQVSNPNLIRLQGRRTPYNIENAKLAMWSIVKDEKKLVVFTDSMRSKLEVEFKKLKEVYLELKTSLEEQNKQILGPNGIWWKKFEEFSKKEQEIFAKIKRIISNITNKIIIFAREISKIDINEQKIKGDLGTTQGKQKIGVMLIHGITASPKDMGEYSSKLQDAGFIVYNVRLPGHGYTIEEFFNTPVSEIEGFLISAFKYFYSYMKKVNGNLKGSGRFYVIGNSIGAMMTFHIMAKRHQGSYIYQSMVKGFISISACLFPVAVMKMRYRLIEPLLTRWIVPYVYRSLANRGDAIIYHDFGKIGKIINEIKLSKRIKINDSKFPSILKEKLKPVIISEIKETKKRFLTKGELNIYPAEAEEGIIDLVIERILHNIRAGLPPLTAMDIQDIKLRAERQQPLPGRSRKAIADLGVLIYGLKKEVKHISIPVFIIHGVHDTIAHIKSAYYLKNHIGTATTNRKKPELLLLPRSGHIPTMDFDKYVVFENSIQFIKKVEKQDVKLQAVLKTKINAAA